DVEPGDRADRRRRGDGGVQPLGLHHRVDGQAVHRCREAARRSNDENGGQQGEKQRAQEHGFARLKFAPGGFEYGRPRYHRHPLWQRPRPPEDPMITQTAVHHLNATELLDLYRRRALSPVEVVRAVLDRIALWEPRLKATYALDPDAALAGARA